MSDTTHRAFLGDQIRDFRLTPPQIIELERLCRTGIGGIVRRIFVQDYSLTEATETIRLALIGGGTDPEEAAALIAAYISPLPLVHAFTLATDILSATMLGEKPAKKSRTSKKDAA